MQLRWHSIPLVFGEANPPTEILRKAGIKKPKPARSVIKKPPKKDKKTPSGGRVKSDKPGGIPPKPEQRPVDEPRPIKKKKNYRRPKEIGQAIPFPKEPKVKLGQAPISNALLYQHMVRAIYNRIQDTGYPTRGTPAYSAQAIARGQLIKWGYAGRLQKKGGTADRRMIQMTAKGQDRSRKKHSREAGALKQHKNADYRAIVQMDPY